MKRTNAYKLTADDAARQLHWQRLLQRFFKAPRAPGMGLRNDDLSAALEALAELAALAGENPFATRAYRKAARAVRGLSAPLCAQIAAGADPTDIDGIGKGIAEKLIDLCRTGTTPQLDRLRAEVPPGVEAIRRLPGIGPEKARRLWREHGLANLEALLHALEAGDLDRAKGFGPKTRAALQAAARERLAAPPQLPLVEADRIVRRVREHLQAAGATHVDAADAVRRREPLAPSLVLVASVPPSQQADLQQAFAAFSEWAWADAHAQRARLRDGLPVTLMCCPPAQRAPVLAWATGPAAHVRWLQQQAAAQGWTLDATGLHGRETGPPATEAALYQVLSLPWVPPERRHAATSPATAAQPRLLAVDEIRGNLHAHTTASDGRLTLAELVEAARARGLTYLVVTDHSAGLSVAGGLDSAGLQAQLAEVRALDARYDDFDLYAGIEAEVDAEGCIDLDPALLAELDLVMLGVHQHQDLDPARQTQRLLRAFEHPGKLMWAHPRGRLLGRRPGMRFDVARVLDAARVRGVAAEINAQPKRLDLGGALLAQAVAAGIEIAVNTDAHTARDFDVLPYGVEQARRAGLGPDAIINARDRVAFRAWLDAR